MFEGAYLEVSRSGRGLHIIFTYLGEFPPHAKKNTALSIELYHDKRYISWAPLNAAHPSIMGWPRPLPSSPGISRPT